MATGPRNECSRRGFTLGCLAAAAIGAIAGEAEAKLATADGTQIYLKHWGVGQPVVLSPGWPLNSDAFEDQMFLLASQGYCCIAHDRRGHGRSGQSWGGNDMDTYADDPAALVRALDLKNAVHASPAAAIRNLPNTIRCSPEAAARSWASMLALFSTTLAERTGVADRVAA